MLWVFLVWEASAVEVTRECVKAETNCANRLPLDSSKRKQGNPLPTQYSFIYLFYSLLSPSFYSCYVSPFSAVPSHSSKRLGFLSRLIHDLKQQKSKMKHSLRTTKKEGIIKGKQMLLHDWNKNAKAKQRMIWKGK